MYIGYFTFSQIWFNWLEQDNYSKLGFDAVAKSFVHRNSVIYIAIKSS